MSENKGLISVPEKGQLADSSIELKEKALAQVQAREYVEALGTAKQIDTEEQRVEVLKAIVEAAHPGGYQAIALRALLLLPIAERNAILAGQVEAAKDCFLPGSEEMEWVEEYVEDDYWDNE